MKKRSYYLSISILCLFGLFLIPGCDKQFTHEAGFLEGKITIGPLCPVERDPPDPGCLPTAETYKAYPVSIWTSDGRRKVTQVNPELNGSYKLELGSGNYLVKLETENFKIGASNLPVEVSIVSQNETILNIDIDTGIR